MITRELSAYRTRVRSGLEATIAETHTPEDIAASFAFGLFVTTLPTLGTGLLLFVVVAYRFERVSKLALFSSVVILNPIAKWGVYVASFWLGSLLIGSPGGLSRSTISFSSGPDIVLRLLVGNVVLAVVLSVVGYLAIHRLVLAYRKREIDLREMVAERTGG